MEPNPVEKLTDAPTMPIRPARSMDGHDEINLAHVWNAMARRKRIIWGAIACCLLASVFYLVLTKPVYKASANLLPPRQASIQGLLVDGYGGSSRLDVQRYTSDFVYTAFLHNLRSRGLRREFFDTHELARHYMSSDADKDANVDHIFDTRFNKNLQVEVGKSDPSVVMVDFSDANPELAAQLLNQIVEFANERTIKQLVDGVNAAIQARISQVRYQIASKLKLAEQRRHDRIARLREALHIAKALGINEGGTFPTIENGVKAGLAVNTAELPLYMRGAAALQTEIAVLESRKSDEPFITGYRDLQETRTLLEGISIDMNSLSAFTWDEVARTPYVAENPRIPLVILLAALLGITIGLVAVLFAEMLSRIRYGASGGGATKNRDGMP